MPTPAAQALEPQARLLAQQLQQLNQQSLALHAGLEKRLTLVIAPELLSSSWAEHLRPVVQQYPALVVEVLTAPQADALELLHAGRAHLALVFERPTVDAREGFQEQGAETLVAVMSPRHPLWQHMQAQRETHIDMAQLASTRQILVASRDLALTDTRFVFSHHLWRADSHGAARSLIAAGLCWGWLPHSFVEPYVHSGELVRIPFSNLSNGTKLFVDWVWSKERPLGLAGTLFVQQLQQAPAAGASTAP